MRLNYKTWCTIFCTLIGFGCYCYWIWAHMHCVYFKKIICCHIFHFPINWRISFTLSFHNNISIFLFLLFLFELLYVLFLVLHFSTLSIVHKHCKRNMWLKLFSFFLLRTHNLVCKLREIDFFLSKRPIACELNCGTRRNENPINSIQSIAMYNSDKVWQIIEFHALKWQLFVEFSL